MGGRDASGKRNTPEPDREMDFQITLRTRRMSNLAVRMYPRGMTPRIDGENIKCVLYLEDKGPSFLCQLRIREGKRNSLCTSVRPCRSVNRSPAGGV